MAIGLSRIFGVRLPLNFNSPYKSTNISEFWRRWHMTLSRFLRDYLYIPMGGNKLGSSRRYVNLLITMVLGGLWHGAGWNFAIWGFLHGLYLVINNAWKTVAEWLRFPTDAKAWRLMATGVTFLAVCVAWIFFRASALETSIRIFQGITGGFGIGLPDAIGNRLGGVRPILENVGVTFFLGGGTRFVETWSWVLVGAIIAFRFPNTQQIMSGFDPALDFQPMRAGDDRSRIHWLPLPRWAVITGILFVAGLLSIIRPSEFLYFQF